MQDRKKIRDLITDVNATIFFVAFTFVFLHITILYNNVDI